MKRIKAFEDFTDAVDLAEIYQSSGLRFAFISTPKDGNRVCHAWVKCRDFLHDAIRSRIYRYNKGTIYGFGYDYNTNPPIDLRRTRMIVKNIGKDFKDFSEDMKYSIRLINFYEKIGKFNFKTKAYPIKSQQVWIFNGSNIWQKSPALLSMFTFLIRLGEKRIDFKTYDELEEKLRQISESASDNDAGYLKYTYDVMYYVVKYREEIFAYNKNGYDTCYFTNKSVSTFHDNSGIVSLSKLKYTEESANICLKELIMEEVMEHKKKKLLKVKKLDDALSIYDSYDPDTIRFSMVSDPKSKYGRKQVTYSTICRESLVGNIHTNLLRHNTGHDEPVVDMNTMRLLIDIPGVKLVKSRRVLNKRKLMFGKALINIIEKEVGIKKSVISTVLLCNDKGNREYAWLITGSNEWIKSPVMLSIYTLFLRAGAKLKSYKAESTKLDNVNDLKTFFDYVRANTTTPFKDLNYICKYWDTLINIIRKRDKLFSDDIFENYFAVSEDYNNVIYYSQLGVDSLIKKKNENKELVKTYSNVIEV